MEREIKIDYNPQRTYATNSGEGFGVGLMSVEDVTALIASLNVIWISPTGLDSLDGETSGNAVRTIAKGIELCVAGDFDAIVFMPGKHEYLASHNLFGKKAIAQHGAQFFCLGTASINPTGFPTDLGWSFDSYSLYNFKMVGVLHPFYQENSSGSTVWFTGREDVSADASKANRLYMPYFNDGGTMRLGKLRVYINGFGQLDVVDVNEIEWQLDDFIPAVYTYFIDEGYPSVQMRAANDADFLGLLLYVASEVPFHGESLRQSLNAMTDGSGRVMLVTHCKGDLSGGTAWKRLTIVWHGTTPQYWYETVVDDGLTNVVPLGTVCYGSATEPGPMIRESFLNYGSYATHTVDVINPNKRIGDTGYGASVTRTITVAQSQTKYLEPATYWDGVPMFSSGANGECFSAQQLADAITSAGGVWASLPSYAKTYLETPKYNLPLEARSHGPYNKFESVERSISNINPNSPFMVAKRMLSTVFPNGSIPSTKLPHFFDSADALSDNMFYGGAAINFRWFAERSAITKALDLGPSVNHLQLPVHGLGVNTRLQNCDVEGCDPGAQNVSYLYGYAYRVPFGTDWATPGDRLYIEGWFPEAPHSTDLAGGNPFSEFLRISSASGGSISRKAIDEARVKNSIFVSIYQIAENVELWHVSAATCGYAATNEAILHACNFAGFSGYYLTPDGSPVDIRYSVVREALAQNLIPPGSNIVECTSGDPFFKSGVNPYDLRLQAIDKGDFFESPAIGKSPETSVFGGFRESGAFDDKGSVSITWDSFLIVFPWIVPTESERNVLSNLRRDGVRTKIAVSENSIRLPLTWQVALSEPDLRNLEKVQRAPEALVRVYFNPVAEPTKFLLGYVEQKFKHGGPMGLLSKTSGAVVLDIHVQQPTGSIYDYL